MNKNNKSMDAEASSFESSEMLATFLASTPLLSDSWRLCSLANTSSPAASFVIQQNGNIGYVSFSGIQNYVGGSDPSSINLVPLESAGNGIFSPIFHTHGEGEEPVMVHAGMLHLFLSIYSCPSFQSQMLKIMESSKSIIVTGHSIGGTTASLSALWLLSHLHSISSSISLLCITFGSPLLGNPSLARAILTQKWSSTFCHVVSNHDLMPRLLFSPLSSLSPHLHLSLLPFWHLSMTHPSFGKLAVQPREEEKAELFGSVLAAVEVAAAEGGVKKLSFWPFGNFVFCSSEGGICVENAAAVVKMMHLTFLTGSPSCSVEDHLRYGDFVGILYTQCLKKRGFGNGDVLKTRYEIGVELALQSSGIANQESEVGIRAKECLKMARQMGRRPNLNSANLATMLSKINPYRAEIEWYKTTCDESDDQMGYYDSFKRIRGVSKRESRVNMNRIKLARFWDNVIRMVDQNQLPHDFHRRNKWVCGSQFYKLLVEPLDIAEYYRSGKRGEMGHYIEHGRERRYKIFDRWWREREVGEEESKKRSRFASLTQDSCFWAKVEEAREWLDVVKTNTSKNNLGMLWEKIDEFERYALQLVERKEVSADVLARNSSYTLWVEELKEVKIQVMQFPPQFTGFLDGEVVP